MNPKAFVSHATEDKERFVLEFARRLRSNGVDAWLDKWEMLPGDSIVDKIFEEGIKDAPALIVVLSNDSVGKKWVREELNAAFISRIENGTKIIPVIIDECEVPEALKSTLWIRIHNFDEYDAELATIISAVFGSSQKPPLGNKPEYIKEVQDELPTLSKCDTYVLKQICEWIIKTETDVIDPDELFSQPDSYGLTRQQITDSLDILEDENILESSKYFGSTADSYCRNTQVTTYGFQLFSNAYYPAFDRYKDECAGLIVNQDVSHSAKLIEITKAPAPVIEFAIDTFERLGYIEVTHYSDGTSSIWNVTAKFRRAIG